MDRQTERRMAAQMLMDVTEVYAFKIVKDECNVEHIVPGAAVWTSPRPGNIEPVLAFMPFVDQIRSIGDHAVLHSEGHGHSPFDDEEDDDY